MNSGKINFLSNLFRIFLAFSFFSFLSCSQNEANLPQCSGNAGEVIVVMENQYWNSAPGESIKNTLGKNQYGLPQGEPIFKLVHISPKDFAKIFQTHRNLFISDFSKNFNQIKSELKSNSWAKGQVVIKLSASSDSSFASFIEKNSEYIIEKFAEAELERMIEKNKIQGKIIQNNSGKNPETIFSLYSPKDSYLAMEDSNFFWVRLERKRNLGGYEHQISQGVFVFWQNYTDTMMLTNEKIIWDIDSVSRKYIPGNVPGSYMTTSEKLLAPEIKKINFKNQFAVETRGLWRMENDFMGGPFISLTWVDKKSNLLISAKGYVFAPQFDKIMYLKEVEAMIKSITLN